MHDPTFSDDAASPVRSLRDRLGGNAEERLGKALSELLESPLFTGAIGRAFDAREKAAQAQEVALGALNLPSAADIERLTRRIRSLSQRLESIEDGVERLDSTRLAERRAPAELEARLERVEQQLDGLLGKLDLLLTRVQQAAQEPAGAAPRRTPAEAAPEAGARPRRRPPRTPRPQSRSRRLLPRKAEAKPLAPREAPPKAAPRKAQPKAPPRAGAAQPKARRRRGRKQALSRRLGARA